MYSQGTRGSAGSTFCVSLLLEAAIRASLDIHPVRRVATVAAGNDLEIVSPGVSTSGGGKLTDGSWWMKVVRQEHTVDNRPNRPGSVRCG